MLILLPPSEGKAAPRRRGRPVDLADLGLPGLTETRAGVRDALVETSSRPDALALLGAPAGAAAEVRRNVDLARLPAAGALQVYTGVLYDALDFDGLSTGAKRRARTGLRVQSALWGPVGPADRIAPYRLSMSATLPGLGPLGRVWRQALEPAMTELAPDGLVVDCRSSTYAVAWAPSDLRRLVAVRVFTESAGVRTVVSHQAKHTRGLVARWLLEAPGRICRPDQVAAVVGQHRRCELVDLGRRGFAVDVIEPPIRPARG